MLVTVAPEASVEQLLEAALEKRQSLADDVSCFRLIHDSADGFLGLTVDRYESVLLVEQHRREAHVESLLDALSYRFGSNFPIFLKQRCLRNERGREGNQVRGKPVDSQLVVTERGLRFSVDLAKGMHTGLFLDSRPAREAVRRQARDLRVLNLFSYTGAFGVAAAAGGARSTTNVDNKKTAAKAARINYALNESPLDTRTFLTDDAIRFLNRAARGRGRYDLVIADPPPRFRRPGGARFDARDGLSRLIARCTKVLVTSGGMLLVGLSSRSVDDESFARQLDEGAALADCTLEIQERIGAGPDFPSAAGRPIARFVMCALV